MENATILIIEDNEEVRENLGEILELYGYQIYTEPDGLAGVRAAIRLQPDLILCDVMMPELDGYGVLNLLSENEATAGTPFVFITARTETEDIRRGMNLGADDYITKPFYKDELLNVIRTRLKKAGARAKGPAANQPRLSDPKQGMERLKAAFSATGRRQVFEPRQIIIREGAHPHFVYQVVEGHLHLSQTHAYGRDYIHGELGVGEIFGIPTVLEQRPFYYTAKAAASGVTVEVLPAEQLLKLINTDRGVTEAVMHLMAGKVMSNSDRLVHQAYDSVRRRTALVLYELYEKYDGAGIELSRDELAQMVGSTKETVIRTLSGFKSDGIISIKGKSLFVEQPEQLRDTMG